MMYTTRGNGGRATLLLLVLAFSLQCTEASDERVCGDIAGVVNVEPTRRMTFDLDCDGYQDTIVIDAREAESENALSLSVYGSLSGTLPLLKDGEIIGIADFNSDGILDVALQRFDESSVTADVVLVGDNEIRLAPFNSADDRRAAMYVLHDIGLSEQCVNAARPRIGRATTGELLIDVATGDYYESADCETVERIQLRLTADSIRRR